MKNLIWITSMVILCVNISISQNETTNKISADVYDEKNYHIKSVKLQGQEADIFDAANFINENLGSKRITIRGDFHSNAKMTLLRFDSNKLDEFDQVSDYCPTSTFSMKAVFGIGGKSTEDFTGVVVEKVVADSPADLTGVLVNDVITTFNGQLVETFCDILLELKNCEAGQSVPFVFIRNGEIKEDHVTIGGRLIEKINFIPCNSIDQNQWTSEDEIQDNFVSMDVFPNPTNGISYMKFNSTSNDPLNVYLMDAKGGIIKHTQHKTVNASVSQNIIFNDFKEGTYLLVAEQGNQIVTEKIVFVNQ